MTFAILDGSEIARRLYFRGPLKCGGTYEADLSNHASAHKADNYDDGED